MNRVMVNFVFAFVALSAPIALMGQGVTAAEYFWDDDPGQGNGTPMQAADGSFGQAVENILLETTALPAVGAHTLGIRVRGANNAWGPLFTTVVVVDHSVMIAPEIAVTTAEYFWDSDPGTGNGTVLLAFDGDFNHALEAIMLETTTLPAVGTHVLHLRARDANDAWGPPFGVVVDVMPGVASLPEVRVSAGECYVNTDPGEGNGTPLLAMDGDFSAAFEGLRGGAIPAPVESGVNVLWLRARDVNGAWGVPFGIVANIDTTITDIGTAVPVFVDDRSMSLRPNPSTNTHDVVARFDTPRNGVHLVLLDAAGKMVAERYAGTTDQVEVPLRGVSPGVYHVIVNSEGGKPERRKLVVQ